MASRMKRRARKSSAGYFASVRAQKKPAITKKAGIRKIWMVAEIQL